MGLLHNRKKVRRTFFQIRVKSEELRVKDEIRLVSRISTIIDLDN